MSGEITGLEAQRNRRDRVSVFVDGRYAFSLQGILAAELHQGQELTDHDIQDLEQRDAAETAYERALHYLSFRPRSEWEIRRYLQKKRGVDGGSTEDVLARLRRVGLVNDGEFARYWVENRESFRPRGRWALRAELRQKGVPPEAIEASLADLDEEASAMNAARRRARRLARLDEGAFHRRLLGFLQRRGFDYGVSRKVASHLWRELCVQREAGPAQRVLPDDT